MPCCASGARPARWPPPDRRSGDRRAARLVAGREQRVHARAHQLGLGQRPLPRGRAELRRAHAGRVARRVDDERLLSQRRRRGSAARSGSNCCLTRAWTVATAASSAAGGNVPALDVHDADAQLGDERPAGRRRPIGTCSPGATTARCGRQRRRSVDRREARLSRPRRATSAGCPSSSTHARRAVPQHRRPGGATTTNSVDRVVGLGDEPLRVLGDRAGAQDDVAEEAERAPRPDQQAAHVEPADVLDRRSAGLHDLPVGADVAGLQQRVAHRPVAQPADAAATDRQRATDGAARRQHRPLPDLGQRSGQVVDRTFRRRS